MKYILFILFTSLFFSAHSQILAPSLSNGNGQSLNSYILLKTKQASPFVFQFSTQTPQTNYFDVKAVPSFNALPSLFCKLEYKLETKSKLAPRFRLGSLGYTNWMEGKGSVYDRYYK